MEPQGRPRHAPALRDKLYSLLALRRWGRITAEDLAEARVVGHGLPVKDDAEVSVP